MGATENPSPTANMGSPSPAIRSRCSIPIESATTQDANPPGTKLQKTGYLVLGRDSMYGVFAYVYIIWNHMYYGDALKTPK